MQPSPPSLFRRLRRLVLGAALAAGAVPVLGGGCAAPFDPPSKVNALRVLAVTADKPYARPGERVTFEMTYHDSFVDPETGPRSVPVQIAWLGGCFDPLADAYFGCFDSLKETLGGAFASFQPGQPLEGELFKGELGEADYSRFSITIPGDIVSRRPKPDTGPYYGLSIVFFVVCAGEIRAAPAEESGRAGSFPIACFESGTGKRLGADSFVPGYTQIYTFDDCRTNANPPIQDLLLDGKSLGTDVARIAPEELAGADTTCAGGAGGQGNAGGQGGAGGSGGGGGAGAQGGGLVLAEQDTRVDACPLSDDDRKIQGCAAKDPYTECTPYEIRVNVPSTVGEIDPDAKGSDGKSLSESVWVDYYADAGDFESDVKLVNDPTTGFNDDLGTRWIPPGKAGRVNLWAVVHDSRGGQSAITRAVIVRCRDKADCGEGNVCNATLDGLCTQCETSADCKGETPICDTVYGGCVQCLDDSQCGDADLPKCKDRSVCVECLDDSQCDDPELPKCSDSSVCVECLDDSDCGAGLECAKNRCKQPCQKDGDCTSGACDTVAGYCS